MANYERSDDVRVFDAAEDEEDVEGSRLPLLIVIALFVLAAFGAVVWLAYQQGVRQGHAEAPRLIAAEPGPAKVAPTDAGGTPTPHTGLKIYEQPAPSDVDASDEAPPPPAAALKPSTAEVPPAKPETTPAAPPATTPKPVAMAPVATPPAATLAPPAAKPTPPPAKPVPTPAKPAQMAATAPPKPLGTDKPAVPPKPVETPAAKPMATAAPAAGTGLLQIGSYKSEAEANAAWAKYKGKHGSLVGGLSSDVQQADLGAKGTWYRLRIVAGSKADATALCAKLKADGGDCLLAK